MDSSLKKILAVLSENQFNVNAYNLPFIRKRINSRMKQVNSTDYENYYKLLMNSDCAETEFSALKKHFSLNITRFFRNKEVWDYLSNHIIPNYIIKNLNTKKFNSKDEQMKYSITAWSVGCSIGAEAYSLAIVFKEIANKEDYLIDYTIFGTDFLPHLIERAKLGIYSDSDLVEVTQKQKQTYFKAVKNKKQIGSTTKNMYSKRKYFFEISDELKDHLQFFVHDLTNPKPSPFKQNSIDLVLCRYLLPYFSTNHIKDLIQVFGHVLKQHGILVVGKLEKKLSTLLTKLNFKLQSREYGIYQNMKI